MLESPAFFVSDDEFVALAISLFPPVYGTLVHRFAVVRTERHYSIRHLGGYSTPLDVDPVLYTRLTHGAINRDLDRSVLFTQSAPYSVRKFSPTGQLQWRLDDPDILARPTEFLDVNERGQIVARPYPVAVALLPIGPDQYLHEILEPKPRDGVTTLEEMNGSFFFRTFEILRADGGDVQRVATFDLDDLPLTFLHRDEKGRLYGYWYDGLNAIVRSEVLIDYPER